MAYHTLSELQRKLRFYDTSIAWQTPRINPEPEGGISCEWSTGDGEDRKQLILDVSYEEKHIFTFWSPKDGKTSVKSVDTKYTPDNFLSLWFWLHNLREHI